MSTVSNDEHIARILNNDWFDEGVLLHIAFLLRENESYISVNRPAVETYIEDVETFISSHLEFLYHEEAYRRALLNVGDVNSIAIEVGETKMKACVEVEPRDAHTKSHAGIFTRFQNKNIKRGQLLKAGPTSEEISADTILLEVRMALLEMATIEECQMVTGKE